MPNPLVISVSRKARPSETVIHRVMAALAVIFLLQGIFLSSGFMLPCFGMAACWFWYGYASKNEYEYTLADETLTIERVSDRGRRVMDIIPFSDIILICRPDAPEAMPYKKGGSIPVVKKDYTSYREGVPWYTLIAREDGKTVKLLLDLTDEALRMIRRRHREAVSV